MALSTLVKRKTSDNNAEVSRTSQTASHDNNTRTSTNTNGAEQAKPASSLSLLGSYSSSDSDNES